MSMLEDVTPDVILLDLSLPDANGLSLMVYLKTYPRLQKTHVVVVSGNKKQAEQVKKAGINHFLSKPVSIPTLLEVVESLAGKPARPLPGTGRLYLENRSY